MNLLFTKISFHISFSETYTLIITTYQKAKRQIWEITLWFFSLWNFNIFLIFSQIYKPVLDSSPIAELAVLCNKAIHTCNDDILFYEDMATFQWINSWSLTALWPRIYSLFLSGPILAHYCHNRSSHSISLLILSAL